MFVRTLRATRAFRAPVRYVSTVDKVPVNDPVERAAKPNVSETNVTPTSSEGSFDKVLQEDVADAERMRALQAPNYKGVWSRSQQPREVAMSGPRFEQSIIEDQVCLFDTAGPGVNKGSLGMGEEAGGTHK
jgi:NADH dehydrogenase (ubiquinone) Fe-S protein 6